MRLIDVDKYPCTECEKKCPVKCDKFYDWLNTPIQYDTVHCSECKYWDTDVCPMCYYDDAMDDLGYMEPTLINNADPTWFCSEGRRL